jgi:hypothetical protein
MRTYAKRNKPVFCGRRGVSILEFVGCLIALCGGAVLGMVYLGVDVQTLAVETLEKADIAVPQLWGRGESVVADVGVADAGAGEIRTEDSLEVAGEEAVSDFGSDGEALPLAEDVVARDQEALVERLELTEAERRAATQTYWAAFSESVQEEARNRSKGIKDPNSWLLFDFLMHRKLCHQTTVEAIEALETQGVDTRLLAHADQVLAWQTAGVELFDRASFLLTDAPAGKLTGPFAQSWQSAATQHRMEEKLILSKHAAVASYLEHRFKASVEASSAR